MKTFLLSAAVVCCSLIAFAADDAPQPSKPSEEHAWLKQFVGNWESKGKAEAAPGSPAFECSGTVKAHMLGDLWVVSHVESDMGGGHKMTAIQTIGYDPKTKKYVGTWVDSMMNHLWKYEGTVDKTGKILTLEAEGPNFLDDGKTTAKFRDIYEFKSKDQIAVSSQMQDKDGKWTTFMTGTSVRSK